MSVLRGNTRQKNPRSLWNDALNSIWHDKLTMGAIFVLIALSCISILGPVIAENYFDRSPNKTDVLNRYRSPGEASYVLGTDQLGRDQLSRLMVGGRISLGIAYAASALSISIGVILGAVAGYYGGQVDMFFIWFITTLTSIPSIFVLLLVAFIWSPSPLVLILILAFLSWVDTARLVRAEVLALRESDFILAAYASGASGWRILSTHMLPNLLPMVIVNLTINAGTLILTESALSFLGIGIQPPTASWGNMLTEARSYFVRAVHLVIWPGLLISVTVICFYLVGDGLRDALDPRSAQQRTFIV